MPDYSQKAQHSLHVRQSAANTRLQSVRAQLSLAFTFCSLAETELDYHQLREALKLIKLVQRICRLATHHLDELHHVPARRMEEVRSQLVQLKKRLLAVEALCQKYLSSRSAATRHRGEP
jgi:hypothetical protein